MAWLSRLAVQCARTFRRPALLAVHRGAPQLRALESSNLGGLRGPRFRDGSSHTAPVLRMALPTLGTTLSLGRPRLPATLLPAITRRGADARCTDRSYSGWQQCGGRQGGGRRGACPVLATAAPVEGVPEEPGERRHASTKAPWWRLWEGRGSSEGQDPEDVPPPPLPHTLPSAARERELHAVNTAVGVNGVIMVAKFVVWGLTGSGALLAEALHSFADVLNQVLLRMGVVQSRRAPTTEHPYGFHREKYIYSLMSAVSIFCLGAGASLLHGIQALWHPPQLQDMAYSLVVLGGSSLLELYSLTVAAKAMMAGAVAQGVPLSGWQDWMRYIMRGRDPTTAAVLAEDLGAVAGLGIASVFTTLTWMTGNPVFDACGSMGVGLLMGAIAMMLIRNNKQFLIGRSMRPADHERIVDLLQSDPMVVAVLDAKSEELGDGVYRFKAEIQWSGERVVEKYLASTGRSSVYRQLRTMLCTVPMDTPAEQEAVGDALDTAMMEFGKGVIRTVGEEIDRLETEMKALVPGLAFVDLETDKGKAEARAWAALPNLPPQQGQQQP